jgi:hypothetical protein
MVFLRCMNSFPRRLVYSSILAVVSVISCGAEMIGSLDDGLAPSHAMLYTSGSLLLNGDVNQNDFSAEDRIPIRNSLADPWSEDASVVGLVDDSNRVADADSAGDNVTDSASEGTAEDHSTDAVIGEVVIPTYISGSNGSSGTGTLAAEGSASTSGWWMYGSMWLAALLAGHAGFTMWRRQRVLVRK